MARATRGEELLGAGRVGEAREVFEAVLARLGEAPSYRRAVVLGRLGRCSHAGGRPDLAVAQLGDALGVAARLAPSDGVKGLRGVLQAELGDALRALGRHGDARRAYESALEIAEAARDLRGQGVDLGQLGALALAEGRLEEARARYQAALRLFQQLREPALEAVAWHQLGRVAHAKGEWDDAERQYREAARIREASGSLAGAVHAWSQLALLSQDAGRPETAEGWYRKAIDVDRQLGDPLPLGRHLGGLADLLKERPGRLVEARRLAEEALVVLQSREPAAGEAWKAYGTLADVVDNEAAATADGGRRAALQAQARAYRELQRRAPPILAALARLGDAPSHGRAVLLGRLGRCFHLGGRPDLALPHLRDAIGIAESLAPSDVAKGLRGTLQSDLGDAFLAIGRHGDARKAYETAVEIAEERKDLWGHGVGLGRLGTLETAEGRLEEARMRGQAALEIFQRLREPALEAAASARAESAPRGETGLPPGFEITVHEDEVTDYVFEPDLLLDGRRERRIAHWAGEPDPLPDGLRPALAPSTRAWADDDGAVRFGLPAGEPLLERQPGCIVMRRTRREVAVSGSERLLWRLVRRMDGACTVAEILAEIPTGEREGAARLLAALAATGALDGRGRPLARFLHSATKKGVLPGGGLGSDEVLRLATDE
ncbi:MAG TPA: tetratricopeptide repeat protein, partial [Vicinamibacteria bacterium]|nr:tetratricopeptide repeat protein [Vicinamibacteria bacterium]